MEVYPVCDESKLFKKKYAAFLYCDMWYCVQM